MSVCCLSVCLLSVCWSVGRLLLLGEELWNSTKVNMFGDEIPEDEEEEDTQEEEGETIRLHHD